MGIIFAVINILKAITMITTENIKDLVRRSDELRRHL